MTNNDLVNKLIDFDDAMVTIQQDLVQDYGSTCQECDEKYHTGYAQLTGDDCPACFKYKNLNVRFEHPVSVIESIEPDFNRLPGEYYQEPHHSVDRAIKAHEESGGVFNPGRKIL